MARDQLIHRDAVFRIRRSRLLIVGSLPPENTRIPQGLSIVPSRRIETGLFRQFLAGL